MGVRLLAVFAVAAAMGLAACGGRNDAAEPPTTAPPQPADTRPVSPEEQSFPAEFVKKVDPVCVKALGEVDKHAGAGIEIKDPGTLEKIAAAYEDAGTELDGQKPPEQNATAYGRFTQAFHDGGDLFTRMADEASRDPKTYARVPSTVDQVNTDVKDLADQFGFTKCAGA